MTEFPSEQKISITPPRLAVSRREAAHAIGCSIQHIDDLCNAGRLKKIPISARRVAITWASLVQLVENAEAA